MGIGIFDAKKRTEKKLNVSMMRYAMLCIISLCSFSSFAAAPSFVGGSMLNLPACMNQGAISINSLLAVSDPDAGDIETWSIVSGPLHGSLGGFSTSVTSTGGTLTPSGLTYTPTFGYTGFDTFVISIFDGTSSVNATVAVHTRPLPTLTSLLTPPSICDQTVFNYMPTSASVGATFHWNRSFLGGILNAPASGSGNPNETLINTTYYTVPVTYAFTTTANGCSSTQNVVVNVFPTPRLSSKLADTTCNGASYSYVPVTSTPGTVYTWSRAAVTGISPATASGTGNINETLTSSLSSPTTVTYTFDLSANGCNATRNLNVYVVPQPPVTSITTAAPSVLCAGTMYQNFGAGMAPPAGISYEWSAVNAEIFAHGNNNQYILVNFNHAGTASVTLKISGGGSACAGNSTYSVNVSAPGPSTANVLYYNYQLIYPDNTPTSYQWGYDMAGTLDSVAIAGANFQSLPITAPDFINRHYWVIINKSGCLRKVYYNGPVAITNINMQATALNVYPNPANDVLTVETGFIGTAEIAVMNMMGQTLRTVPVTGNKTQLNINDIPAGCYLISCSQNGMRVATARFTKN